MKQKIDLYLFDIRIGQMYQDDDRVYLKQFNNLCYSYHCMVKAYQK